jgi:hypothetical protein
MAGKATEVPSGAPVALDEKQAIPRLNPPSPREQAARSRLRACGTRWQQLKATGQTNGQTWNGFRKSCEKAPPTDQAAF